jgi:hypothetical protein
MRRRCGQNGTIVVQSGWYRVRWRQDIEGQQERINMTAKIAPVLFDKEGKPKPASPETSGSMVRLLSHRQTKGPATDRPHLTHRATSTPLRLVPVRTCRYQRVR